MTDIYVELRKVGPNAYALFGPKGNMLSGIRRGELRDVKEWAENWISVWPLWRLNYSGVDDEQQS